MAIHTLNALVGSLFARRAAGYQMGPSYGPMPVERRRLHGRLRETAMEAAARIDLKGHADGYLLANNMMQDIGPNHLAGDPYKLDTMMFYLTNPIWTAPNGQVWEEAMKDVFIIDTSPFPSRRRCTPTSSCPTTPTSSAAGRADLPVRGLADDPACGCRRSSRSTTRSISATR
jgi:anaerobic selenocysteine-containing dehydrogenase